MFISRILLVILFIVAFLFIIITTVFGAKSDAMSGAAGSIRTTFKGKPGFDDFMSRITLLLGIAFMGLCLLVNILNARFG